MQFLPAPAGEPGVRGDRLIHDRTRAARLLQISYKSPLSKIEEYGLGRDHDPAEPAPTDVATRDGAA